MTDPTPDLVDDGGEHPLVPWLNQRRRAYLYRVLLACVPLGVYLGITAPLAGAILLIAVALIGTGTAAAHTTTKKETP